mmetsp:Transcript_13287/g.27861  ORF Transcript_13287/g.27861 Transcript_13287/m.27861 type:complete len:80 (+) Transcript_13287:271-510(+)
MYFVWDENSKNSGGMYGIIQACLNIITHMYIYYYGSVDAIQQQCIAQRDSIVNETCFCSCHKSSISIARIWARWKNELH